jgi:hypothetical protein
VDQKDVAGLEEEIENAIAGVVIRHGAVATVASAIATNHALRSMRSKAVKVVQRKSKEVA